MDDGVGDLHSSAEAIEQDTSDFALKQWHQRYDGRMIGAAA